jgi:hypothetical protein
MEGMTSKESSQIRQRVKVLWVSQICADLGDAPAMCAARMREAEKLIREALEIARTMQDRAKRGRQAGEVFSLIGIIGALPDKAAYAARRSEGVPNARGEET